VTELPDYTAAIDPLVSLLVGALGASVIGLIGALFGAWIQGRREHRKWLRERRYEAYRTFAVDMNSFHKLKLTKRTAATTRSMRDESLDLLRRFGESFESVSLLGPKKVNEAGQRWMWAANALQKKDADSIETWRQARWNFLIAAGKELRTGNVGDQPLSRDGDEQLTVAPGTEDGD
jgi:hypothetical protein